MNAPHQSLVAPNRSVQNLLHSLIPGIFAGLLIVIMSVSLSALIFSGSLSTYLVDGIAMSIIAAVVVGLSFALFSKCHPIIAQVDEDTAPIFALLAMLVVASIPRGASSAELYTSVMAAITLATVATGVVLALLGSFRIGRFIQYLPHSVMGGYFAALGWLLIVGGFAIAVPSSPDAYTSENRLWSGNSLASWIPALLIGAWLLLMKRYLSRVLLLPGTVAVAGIVWFGIGALLGHGPENMLRAGQLIGPFTESRALFSGPLGGVTFSEIYWPAIATNIGSTGTIFLISVMSLLFCVSGLGLLSRQDPNMNHELKVAGIANIASGLSGGLLGLPSYNLSAQAIDMGAPKDWWSSLVATAVALAVFVFALDVVAYTPRFIISGLLIFIGASLLRDWLVDGWFKFTFLEYLVIPIILLSAVSLGFLQGILVGLIAAVVLFVVKYSRIEVVRYIGSCEEITSNVDRNVVAQRELREHGAKIVVLGLQGYLFFGTADRVLNRLLDRLDEHDRPDPSSVIIDFAQVTGVDASAALNFQKMERQAAERNFELIIAGLSSELQARLKQGGFGLEYPDSLVFVADLDRALEYAENQLLGGIEEVCATISCFEQLRPFLDTDEDLDRLISFLKRRDVEAGTTLTEQGADSTELFFLETCAASASIEQPDGRPLRVRSTEHGTVYGELGFYLKTPRTATVRTDEAGVVYVLSLESLERLEDQHPGIAAALHRFMAMLLSERLLYTTQSLKVMLM